MTTSTTAVTLKGATVQTRHGAGANQMCCWCATSFFPIVSLHQVNLRTHQALYEKDPFNLSR